MVHNIIEQLKMKIVYAFLKELENNILKIINLIYNI